MALADDTNGLSDDALARMLADVERATQRQRWREQALAYDAYLQAGAHPDLLDVPEPVRGRPGSPDTHRDEVATLVLRGYACERARRMPGVGGYAEVGATRLHERRVWEHDSARWEKPSAGRVHAAHRRQVYERARKEMRAFWRRAGEGNDRRTGGDDDGGRAA